MYSLWSKCSFVEFLWRHQPHHGIRYPNHEVYIRCPNNIKEPITSGRRVYALNRSWMFEIIRSIINCTRFCFPLLRVIWCRSFETFIFILHIHPISIFGILARVPNNAYPNSLSTSLTTEECYSKKWFQRVCSTAVELIILSSCYFCIIFHNLLP